MNKTNFEKELKNEYGEFTTKKHGSCTLYYLKGKSNNKNPEEMSIDELFDSIQENKHIGTWQKNSYKFH
jgi:hypothetical protein